MVCDVLYGVSCGETYYWACSLLSAIPGGFLGLQYRLSQSVAMWQRRKIFCKAQMVNFNEEKAFFSLQERRVPLYEFRCIFYIAKVAVYKASVKLCLFLKQKCHFMSFTRQRHSF